jgi:hypothetical protein
MKLFFANNYETPISWFSVVFMTRFSEPSLTASIETLSCFNPDYIKNFSIVVVAAVFLRAELYILFRIFARVTGIF